MSNKDLGDEISGIYTTMKGDGKCPEIAEIIEYLEELVKRGKVCLGYSEKKLSDYIFLIRYENGFNVVYGYNPARNDTEVSTLGDFKAFYEKYQSKIAELL